jgi:hypothetical protein
MKLCNITIYLTEKKLHDIRLYQQLVVVVKRIPHFLLVHCYSWCSLEICHCRLKKDDGFQYIVGTAQNKQEACTQCI